MFPDYKFGKRVSKKHICSKKFITESLFYKTYLEKLVLEDFQNK